MTSPAAPIRPAAAPAVRLVKQFGPLLFLFALMLVFAVTNEAFLTQLNTWKFVSLGQAPQLLDYEGAGTIVQASADGIEMRIGYYGNLVCEAPGHNVNVLV